MSRLVVRGDALHARARSARIVADELDGLADYANDAAAAVGVQILESALRDFSSKWTETRASAATHARELADCFDVINCALAQIDSHLASRVGHS